MFFKLQTHSYRLQPIVIPRIRTVPLPSLLNPVTLQVQQPNLFDYLLYIHTRKKIVFWNYTISRYCKTQSSWHLTQATPLQKNRIKWSPWGQWPVRKTLQQPALLRKHPASPQPLNPNQWGDGKQKCLTHSLICQEKCSRVPQQLIFLAGLFPHTWSTATALSAELLLISVWCKQASSQWGDLVWWEQQARTPDNGSHILLPVQKSSCFNCLTLLPNIAWTLFTIYSSQH